MSAFFKGYPRVIHYVQMMRAHISEKKLGTEAVRQARIILTVLSYSLLAAVLSFIFLSISYFVYPPLTHFFVGDDHTLFKAHIGLFDADFWLRMSLFEGIVFFVVHLIVGIFTSRELSLKTSLITAGSFTIIFLPVMTETSAFFYPILFLPVTACVFLFWPTWHLKRKNGANA